MSFDYTYKLQSTQIWLLVICLLVNDLNVTCHTLLSVECNRQKYTNGCLFHHFIRCDKRLNECQCKSDFALSMSSLTLCLSYQKLDEGCIHSSQCNKTSNAACYNKESVELNNVQILEQWWKSMAKVGGKGAKYDYQLRNWGKCKCKVGYTSKYSPNKCQKVHLSQLLCDGSHQCMNWDLNSHCDRRTKHCTCDTGYFYDTDHDRCVMSAKKWGESCITNIECRSWDPNMDCRSSRCVCHNKFHYDPTIQRCKSTGSSTLCRYGYTWNEFTGDCHIIRGTGLQYSGVKGLTPDKLLEMIIILIIFMAVVFMMRYWRSLLPNYTIDQENSIFGVSRRDSRARRSRNTFGCPRVIRLSVNLESSSSHYPPDEIPVNMSSPPSSSDSSLPLYEFPSTSDTPVDKELPPYGDAPPTYEETMALCQFEQKNNKSIDSNAK